MEMMRYRWIIVHFSAKGGEKVGKKLEKCG